MSNKEILEKANQAISKGNYEGFLALCSEDTKWTFVGEQVIKGKENVRKYMAEAYLEPPKFKVEYMIAEGDFVTALGTISMKNIDYSYCDVWRFHNGKMIDLVAFVIEEK